MKRIQLLIFVLYFLLPLQGQRAVSFFEEHIDFSLDSTYFSINGIFSFRNETSAGVSQPIVFPFAGYTAAIDSIRILKLPSGSRVNFERQEKSIRFVLTLLPGETVDLNIFYRQPSSVENTYIISSTQSWGKPLEIAEYTLTTGTGIVPRYFSYAPDSEEVISNRRRYRWQKTNFLPDHEFEIKL